MTTDGQGQPPAFPQISAGSQQEKGRAFQPCPILTSRLIVLRDHADLVGAQKDGSVQQLTDN
jgi:hypothetical protein